MADAGGARPADHVISMEEGVEASSSPQQQQPPPPSARQHLQKRLSHLASSLRSSALELHVVRRSIRLIDRSIDSSIASAAA